MKYIPQGPRDESELLQALGLTSTEELFKNIPSNLRTKNFSKYPLAQSEMEIRSTFQDISRLSPAPTVSFAGCGIYSHDIPSIVPFLQGRSEFSTAYTPYQAEISQGLLQAIFEFQTLVCQLTECELSNASLYDGATSLAEAVLMGLRIKKKSSGKILISSALHPFYREVLETYLTEFKDRIEELPLQGDQIDISLLKKSVGSGSIDLVVTQSPNVFGVLENDAAIGEIVRTAADKNGPLWITSTMEPFSWGIIKGQGSFGAHIVTAEGQSFGNSPYLGGASYGIFATKNEYLRNLPGRLVGETVDQKNRRSYTLTFATREQFIRRDKATSNICTNQNLNMLAGLIHLITLGKEGIREVALQNLSLTEYLKTSIRKETNLKVSASPTFNEFVIETTDSADTLVKRAEEEGWVCGVSLGRFKQEWKNKLLVHVNEQHRQADLNRLVQFLKKR